MQLNLTRNAIQGTECPTHCRGKQVLRIVWMRFLGFLGFWSPDHKLHHTTGPTRWVRLAPKQTLGMVPFWARLIHNELMVARVVVVFCCFLSTDGHRVDAMLHICEHKGARVISWVPFLLKLPPSGFFLFSLSLLFVVLTGHSRSGFVSIKRNNHEESNIRTKWARLWA